MSDATPTQLRAELSFEAPAAPSLHCASGLPHAMAVCLGSVAAASLFRCGLGVGTALYSLPAPPLAPPPPALLPAAADTGMQGVAPAPRFVDEDWPAGSYAWALKQNAKMDWLETLPKCHFCPRRKCCVLTLTFSARAQPFSAVCDSSTTEGGVGGKPDAALPMSHSVMLGYVVIVVRVLGARLSAASRARRRRR